MAEFFLGATFVPFIASAVYFLASVGIMSTQIAWIPSVPISFGVGTNKVLMRSRYLSHLFSALVLFGT